MIGKFIQIFWKWWKRKIKDILDNKRRLTLVLVFLVALIGICLNQVQKLKQKEHKCKGTKPKSAEPPALRYPPDTEIPLPPSPSILHVFEKAAVCSDSDVCSRIGRDILQQGGNAVDSALATLACNGLVTMQSMGIGGGFIMNVFQHSKNHSSTIIARETAPKAIKFEHFSTKNSKDSNLQGPISIAVPGEVMGYEVAHKKFGSLPWNRILQPTIEICEKGFQLSKHQWDSLFFNPRIRNDPYLREMFVNKSTGEYNRVGSIVHPPRQLCETYRILSENGSQDFYNGNLAEMIAKDLRDMGSIISLDDLKNYQAEILDSVHLNLGSDVLHLVPPVGSGVVIGQVMNILKGYNFDKKKVHSEKILIHRIIEALKFGFASRWKLGDPNFNDHQEEVLAEMLSSELADALRLKINDKMTHSDANYYGGESEPVNEYGTGHLSVLAPNGDAVSITSTIHYYFGSAIMGKRTGILFNSAMGDFSITGQQNYFSLPPSKANLVEPNKRPMSSMAPTIVTNVKGDVKLVIGGAGGPKIISALVNILLRILWLGNDVKQAIDAPRFHHQLIPNFFEYEFGMLKDVVDDLEKMGHKTLRYRERGSAFCGIMKNETAVYANVDFRKLGGVFGF
ncbi:glutathione hydrolase 1 proenzyme-like [Episyrphus balteatus]|uniref:glutathione hydrolase 1 proenzyme-like n=1 Tax=Episyrphus balteatus TaxID=286459 RepID=UPI0024867A0B|nr:glutathione hydrolase 1 proenzyme-like [Episyrphus balteatus]